MAGHPPGEDLPCVPLLLLTACAGPTPSAAAGAGASLHMPPEALLSARLGAGDIVLVAVGDAGVGAAREVASPAPRGHGGGAAAAPPPRRAASPASKAAAGKAGPTPADLWQRHCQLCGCSLDDVAGAAAPSSSQPEQLLGRYLVAASVWPSGRLARGTAAVGGQLWAALAQPAAGAPLLVYRPEGRPDAASAAGGCADAAAASAAAPPAELGLRLCWDSAQQLPLAPPPRGDGEAAAAAAAPPTPPAKLAGGRSPSRSAQRGAPGGAPAPAPRRRALRLLAASVDWASEQQVALLTRLATRHLHGCCLLPGNLVVLPVLGHSVLFRVEGTASHAAAAWQLPTPLRSYTVGGDGARLTLRGPGDGAAALDGGSARQEGSVAAAAAEAALLERAVAAARAAAQGSGEDTAAEAAERAVRAGLAAAARAAPLGGVANLLASLHELVTLPLAAPQLFAAAGVRPPRGVLLHGPPGTGKTALARGAAARAGAAMLVINGPDVVSEFYGASEAGLVGVFAAARALSPAVVFIDEVDAIAGDRGGGGGGGGGGDASGRLLAALLTQMDGLGTDGDGVVVLAATNRPGALDSALRRPGRLERELEVGVPSPAAREEILRARMQGVHHSLTDAQVAALAAAAHGFVGADLAALVTEAALAALRRVVAARAGTRPRPAASGGGAGNEGASTAGEALVVGPADFAVAETRVRPSALREVAVSVPQVSWDDVGGLAAVKQRLKEAVEWPTAHAESLARVGAQPPRGVLLYGPPGCSKTLLARAVASAAHLNFLAVKGGELFSSYVGASERAVAALFARARAVAPAIVFLDELDALAAARARDGDGGGGGGGGGAAERVLAQLLCELDGLQPRLGVVVLAATNRPDAVDPALLRPGRFDRLLFVPPPDAGARAEIFRVHLRRTPLSTDVSLEALATATEGYTGADITAVCREAALEALEQDMDAAEVAMRHFTAALRRVAPSAPPSAAALAMYRSFQRGLSAVG